MTYVAPQDSLDGIAKVIYESKDGKTSKPFDALDWLAQLTNHIPNQSTTAKLSEYHLAIYNKLPGPKVWIS